MNKIYFFLSEYQFVDDVVRSFLEKRCEKVLWWNKKVLLLQSDFEGLELLEVEEFL